MSPGSAYVPAGRGSSCRPRGRPRTCRRWRAGGQGRRVVVEHAFERGPSLSLKSRIPGMPVAKLAASRENSSRCARSMLTVCGRPPIACASRPGGGRRRGRRSAAPGRSRASAAGRSCRRPAGGAEQREHRVEADPAATAGRPQCQPRVQAGERGDSVVAGVSGRGRTAGPVRSGGGLRLLLGWRARSTAGASAASRRRGASASCATLGWSGPCAIGTRSSRRGSRTRRSAPQGDLRRPLARWAADDRVRRLGLRPRSGHDR